MIVIYGNNICPDCDTAKKISNDYNLRWSFKDVSQPENHAEFLSKFPGESRLPQIVWHDRWIGGLKEFVSEIENTRNYGDGKI
jgi:glutaredoxin